MKIELTDEQIRDICIILNAHNDEYTTFCPSDTGISDDECDCNLSCSKCWENALKSLEIKEGE